MEKRIENEYGLLNSVPEPVLAVENGRITFENDAARRLLVEDALGKPGEELFDPELLSADPAPATGVFRHRRGTYLVHSTKRGNARVLALKAEPEEADASRRALSLFTGHIRSGVGTVLTALSLMDERVASLPSGFGFYLARGDKSACIMARTADNFARAFCGLDSVPELKPLDLAVLAEDVVSTVAALTVKGQPSVVFRHETEPAPVKADGRLLELALMQLLSNALKYAGEGSTVSVSVKRGRSRFGVTVSDNGRGVRPEILGDVFLSYASPARDLEPMAGAGLGLGIVQRIAAMHGGSAVLESVWGQGTSVTVSLPRCPAVPRITELWSAYKNELSAFFIQMADVLDSSVFERLGRGM